MDWLAHITSFSGQLADATDRGELESSVPTCPGWTLADLTWHLLEVQDFWTWIIANRPEGPDEYPQPSRPADGDLTRGLRIATAGLVGALGSADPSEAAWSWSSDQTVGFTYRRQAHEAFVHLADAIAAVGGTMPEATTEFGVDGIDEIVANNLAPIPDWGVFTPDYDRLVTLQATDTARSWTLRFGTFSGTSPESGTTYTNEPQVLPTEGEASATAHATATELDLWLWGRMSTDQLTIEGDPSLIDELRLVVAGETQ